MNLATARADWQRFSADGFFSVEITFKSPGDVDTAVIKGIGIKHHLSIDSDGRDLDSKNAHVTVSEALLVAEGYPVRETPAGEVALKDHSVFFADSTGLVKSYVITRTYPDETVGMITCILGDKE